MWYEITIEGRAAPMDRLRHRLAFSELCRENGGVLDGQGRSRLCIREDEKRLDDRLLALADILDAEEQGQEGTDGFEIHVRNLAQSEPLSGSAEFIEPFTPVAGRTIQPCQPTMASQPTGCTVVIDPAYAFGTGKHPSTRLCLEFIAELATARLEPAAGLLDLGCGTGVLAMAAVRLGLARTALGVDLDPQAAAAAARNVGLNGLDRQVAIRTGSWEEVPGRYPVIIANLVSAVMLRAGRRLPDYLQAPGLAIVAGFAEPQAEMIARFFRELGLVVRQRKTLEGWSALLLERN